MTKDELLEQQDKLQKEAHNLLEETGLLEFLSRFGRVEIGGSVDSGLMTWPDIDMGVISENIDDENYWKIVKHLFYLKDYYHSLYIQDFRESVNPDSPKGLYIGLKIKFNNKIWKVDIWYVNPRNGDNKNFNDWLKENINKDNKIIILEIKNQVHEKPNYKSNKPKPGKEISSIDIYKAVIEDGVKDLEGFEKYLVKSGRSLD